MWAFSGGPCRTPPVRRKPIHLPEDSLLWNFHFKMRAEQKQVAKIPAGWADQRTASKLGWQVSRQGWFNWFASLKHIFLLNRESVFDSVWTIVLFRINATKWNLIWIYFLIFKNSTLGIYTFNIFYIQLQHLNIKCWIYLLELLN